MKRIFAVLLAVMLLLAVIPATSLAAGPVSNGDTKVYHVSTNGGTLFLRKGPGTNYVKMASLPNGTPLKKVSSGKGNWIKVKTMNGLTGYVSKTYIRENARADVNTRETGLNVRSSRSSKNNKNYLYSIPHGTRGITVYAVNGNWAKVSYNGKKKGWASLSYLKWTRW